MVFHTFGDSTNKTILLIHGALTPWQIWGEVIRHFSADYFIIVPELDAHTQEENSSFISVENEADQIRDFIVEQVGGNLFMICGLSLGGRIAATLAGMSGVRVDNLILDGAPLKPLPGIFAWFMKRSYISILRGSKRRSRGVLGRFSEVFLPEKFLEDYLKLADRMEEKSIENVVDGVCSKFNYKKYHTSSRILFMHGTRVNEFISRKSAITMKRVNPQTEIRCYDGYAHAYLACFEPEKWTEEVNEWLNICP